MENQRKKIKGYRDLTQDEIYAMNVIKEAAEEVGGIVDTMVSVPELDQRWVSIARTHLQQGFMALTRAVAQPTSF